MSADSKRVAILRRLLAVAVLLCPGSGALVRAQDQQIFQMIHTSWTARDGAPQSINTIAQSSDGTLWLGTRDGLYTFDGIAFTVFRPVSGSVPRKNIQSLFVSKDESVWIFGTMLQPTRIRNGVATVFDRVDQGAFRLFGNLQQASDGTLWGVANSNELVQLGDDGMWHVMTPPIPHPVNLGPFLIDSSDTQWLVANETLYRRAQGEERFASTNVRVYQGEEFKEGQDHTIWIVSAGPARGPGVQPAGQPPNMSLMHVDRYGKRLPNPLTQDDVSDAVTAEDGSLWVSHIHGGLQRLPASQMTVGPHNDNRDRPDLFLPADGLTTTGFRALLRDRDGDIWSAGGRGLDRFQRATLVPVVRDAIGGWWSDCVAADGDIWLSLLDGYRAVIRENRLIRLKDGEILAVLCGSDGKVRFLDGVGIGEIRNGGFVHLPLLPEHGPYWEDYRFISLVVLPDRRPLASTLGPAENGLWIYESGKWKPFPSSAGITAVRAMMVDRRNRICMASNQDKIVIVGIPDFHVLFSADSGLGIVEGFADTSYGVFAFGENGIALEHNGEFRRLRFADPDVATLVTGLAEDRSGDVWINGSRAIARIRSSEITASISESEHRVTAREFHEGDFRGSDVFTISRNSVQVDRSGRLWFPTANGVIYIDPGHVERPSHLPTISVRSISADGRPLPANGNFSPRIETLNVHYFGLNLSDPTSVVYRYRLEGSDSSWQDVGTRTEAVYTHLHPGKYIFEAEASNGDGIWTAPFDSVPFRILPAFYQTWWFESVCIFAGALLLWLGLTMRIRYVAAQIKLRAEERANERMRIARELHDTLLQGIQGLLLSFHAAATKVPPESESRRALEKAFVTADRMIVEGRDRIHRLRSQHFDSAELEPAIKTAAAELGSLAQSEFSLTRTGVPRPLRAGVADEIFYIVREALTNSFRHSGASQVAVALDYRKDHFALTCSDNGRGFAADELEQSERRGHFGLHGMAERADRIGAAFDYESAPSEGTRIRIVLEAKRAYSRPPGFQSFFRRHNAA
jgi:signal transduction histidine kinase